MYVESNDRGPAEYVLFALGFLGFMMGATGVVVSSIAAAVMGMLLLLFAVLCFSLTEA